MGLKWLKIVKNAQMGVIGLAEVKHSHLTLAGENDQLYHPGRNHAHRNRHQKQYHTQKIWALESRAHVSWI